MNKHQRNKNFSEDEKSIIVKFVQKNKDVLENKISEPKINKKKKELWNALAEKLNSSATNCNRDGISIRNAYYRLKQQAKISVTSYKSGMKRTGGGPAPNPPSEMKWAIAGICPIDFEEDPPLYDSDMQQNETGIGLINPETGLIITSDSLIDTNCETNNNHIPVSAEINYYSCPSTSTGSTGNKKRKQLPKMTATQEKMVALHADHITNKISNEQKYYDSERDLTLLKMQHENDLFELKKKKLTKENLYNRNKYLLEKKILQLKILQLEQNTYKH